MIEIRNLTKVYPTRTGHHLVLDNIDLTINRGDKVGILGRNGAGKSTLIRLLSGVDLPTKGTVRRRMSLSWPLAFGGAFQGSLTGLDNLKFICRVYGADYHDKIAFVNEFAELGKFFREPVKTYSAGMRARLAFAISMAIEFDCYLIDEVIAVGDQRFSDKCEIELFEKRKERTLVMVSHIPQQIEKHCNRFFVLDACKIHAFDSCKLAYDYYNSR